MQRRQILLRSSAAQRSNAAAPEAQRHDMSTCLHPLGPKPFGGIAITLHRHRHATPYGRYDFALWPIISTPAMAAIIAPYGRRACLAQRESRKQKSMPSCRHFYFRHAENIVIWRQHAMQRFYYFLPTYLLFARPPIRKSCVSSQSPGGLRDNASSSLSS